MKDLSKLTDEELVRYYDEMKEHESIDYSMDGSGDCGHMIAKYWTPVWEAFDAEFEKREITLHVDCEMPY